MEFHFYQSVVSSCLAGIDELPQLPERECVIYSELICTLYVLSVTNRFDPECEPHLDEVLNQERIHSS